MLGRRGQGAYRPEVSTARGEEDGATARRTAGGGEQDGGQPDGVVEFVAVPRRAGEREVVQRGTAAGSYGSPTRLATPLLPGSRPPLPPDLSVARVFFFIV